MVGLIGALALISIFLTATMHTALVELSNIDSPYTLVVLSPLMIAFWLEVIGIVCVPFAAVSSYMSAKSRGLFAGKCAIRGAGYSASLLLPWLYLMARMRGIAVPRAAVMVTYVALYTCWLILIGGYLSYILQESIPFHSYGLEGVHLGPDSFLWLAAAGISFFTWSLSLLRLWRVYRAVGTNMVYSTRDAALDGAYLHPFVHFLAWWIVVPILAVITVGR